MLYAAAPCAIDTLAILAYAAADYARLRLPFRHVDITLLIAAATLPLAIHMPLQLPHDRYTA